MKGVIKAVLQIILFNKFLVDWIACTSKISTQFFLISLVDNWHDKTCSRLTPLRY